MDGLISGGGLKSGILRYFLQHLYTITNIGTITCNFFFADLIVVLSHGNIKEVGTIIMLIKILQ